MCNGKTVKKIFINKVTEQMKFEMLTLYQDTTVINNMFI